MTLFLTFAGFPRPEPPALAWLPPHPSFWVRPLPVASFVSDVFCLFGPGSALHEPEPTNQFGFVFDSPVLFPRMVPVSGAAAHCIPPQTLTRLAREWLEEDTPNFDPAGVCVGSREVEARLWCKTAGSILAGSPFFTAVFRELGCTVHWLVQEGSEIGKHQGSCGFDPMSVGARLSHTQQAPLSSHSPGTPGLIY